MSMVQGDDALLSEVAHSTELIKYGVVVVASLPMLCLYPFIQKHFVSGIMIGAVKD
jgi:putative aldouronate transport system permease protein